MNINVQNLFEGCARVNHLRGYQTLRFGVRQSLSPGKKVDCFHGCVLKRSFELETWRWWVKVGRGGTKIRQDVKLWRNNVSRKAKVLRSYYIHPATSRTPPQNTTQAHSCTHTEVHAAIDMYFVERLKSLSHASLNKTHISTQRHPSIQTQA